MTSADKKLVCKRLLEVLIKVSECVTDKSFPLIVPDHHVFASRASGTRHVPVRKDQDLLPSWAGGVPGEAAGR